jgi:hypothetical protein
VQVNSPQTNISVENSRQVSSGPTPRSSSPASSILTPPFDSEELRQEQMRRAREAYYTLVAEGGTPSHPVELGFDVLDNPGEYEDILSYWESVGITARAAFICQLKDWRRFRDYQQKVRRHFIQRNDFPEYQRRVRDRRQRRGLEGDVTLLEERDQQNKLDQWIEYQDTKIQALENLQKELEEAHQKRESTQKALEDAGLPGFEGIFKEGNISNNLSLSFEQSDEDSKAFRKMMSAQRELDLAKKRLKTAQSDHFGETVEMATWIRFFLEEADAARVRLSKIPKSEYRVEDWDRGGEILPTRGRERERLVGGRAQEAEGAK